MGAFGIVAKCKYVLMFPVVSAERSLCEKEEEEFRREWTQDLHRGMG